MSLFSAQLYPGRALGFLVLGASLHDVLTRLKAEPQRFSKLELMYDPVDPVRKPVVVGLPANGLRLQFDGPEQRLRLIEVIDFTKNHIFLKPANEKERDLVRPASTDASASSPPGPTFRHIYHRFLGPTYDGEFIPGPDGKPDGIYVLSYPGVAFNFPMKKSEYAPSKDVVSLLSSSAIPTGMAVFSGDSWAQAREVLWTEVLPSLKTFAPLVKGKESWPDEVSLVNIYGGGKLQVFRKWTDSHFWIMLGHTTPQDLITELGPPDAIYRKNDQRMYIHKLRAASNTQGRPNGNDLMAKRQRQDDGSMDTDQSSTNTGSDDYESNDEVIEDDDELGNVSGECFYNYFFLGFDILVSTPTAASQPPPSQDPGSVPEPLVTSAHKDRLVATKVILHSNVPGSYPFNRHRRCRWQIPYLTPSSTSPQDAVIDSETPFTEVEERLREAWKSIYSSEADARQKQRGMVLNRGWGDSPGSSIELLGSWEDSRNTGGVTAQSTMPGPGRKLDCGENSTTTLYGFPGLVFEVLKNGTVSALTVF